MFRFRKLRNFIKDVRNYIKLWTLIHKHRNTVDWNNFNLRVDWVGRIYTVFNPLPAEKGDDPAMLEAKITERIIPCHKYINTVGIGEYVSVSGEKIPETDSYLVVYYPIFSYITTWRMTINAIVILLLLFFRKDIYSLFR
jgi:hypothetical protein